MWGLIPRLGSVPLVGDLFDSRGRPIARISNSTGRQQGQRKEAKDRGFLALVFLILVALLSIPIFLGVLPLSSFLREGGVSTEPHDRGTEIRCVRFNMHQYIGDSRVGDPDRILYLVRDPMASRTGKFPSTTT